MGASSVHEWLVAGGVVESDAGLLLVRNRRRSGRLDWSPPGGVIDPGETVLEGLSREVEEETGISVSRWSGPLYEVRAEAPELGWRLRAEIHGAEGFAGTLRVDDPDGIVDAAEFVPRERWDERLAGQHRWVREPLLDWLVGRWAAPRVFSYLVRGSDPSDIVVTREDEARD